jgi:Zn-finger nucleic acid-binding protein
MMERQGVEIDYCSQCRGVWLDRGELDKIIERSSSSPEQQQPVQQPRYQSPPPPYQERHPDAYYKQKRKKNFLDDIFDF